MASQEMSALYAAVRVAESAASAAVAAMTQAQKDLAYAQRVGRQEKTVQKYAAIADLAILTAEARQGDLALAKSDLAAAKASLESDQQAWFDTADAAVIERFGRADLEIRTIHSYNRVSYELQLLLMQDGQPVIKSGTYAHGELKGQTWSAPEHRFGLHVTAYGPEIRWDGTVEAGSVNWPSLGSQDPATAAEFAALLTLACDVVTFLAGYVSTNPMPTEKY